MCHTCQEALQQNNLRRLRYSLRRCRVDANLFFLAAQKGHQDLVEQWWHQYPSLRHQRNYALGVAYNHQQKAVAEFLSADDHDRMITALRFGDLETCQRLWPTTHVNQDAMMTAAAHSGSVPLLTWLVEQGLRLTSHVLTMAAWHNRRPLLEWCQGQGQTLTSNLLVTAALQGHWDLWHWLRDQGLALHYVHVACLVQRGRLNELKGLDRELLGPRLTLEASSYGQQQVLEWLWDQGCPRDLEPCVRAAANGQQWHLLEWLWQLPDCPHRPEYYDDDHNPAFFRWLAAHGCPCLRPCPAVLVRDPPERVATWPEMNAYEWRAVLYYSALDNRLDLLQALDRRHILDPDALLHVACINGHADLLKWLLATFPPQPSRAQELMRLTLKHYAWRCLAHMVDYGCTLADSERQRCTAQALLNYDWWLLWWLEPKLDPKGRRILRLGWKRFELWPVELRNVIINYL